MLPEERLLRLIESADKGPRQFAFWDVRTWPALFFSYKEKANRLGRTRWAARFLPRELSITLINRGLVVVLVLVAAAIGLNIVRKVGPSPTDLLGQAALRTPGGADQASIPLRPLEDYLAAVEKRDLFNLVAPPKPEKPAPRAEPGKPPELAKPPEPAKPPKPSIDILREKAKTLKLVGVAWGETPVAMIEDTAKGETSFLRAGQSINDIRVKAILRDRVVLGHEDAEYDLQ